MNKGVSKKYFFSKSEGVTLLYAVLVLGSVVLVSLAIASLTLRSLHLAQDYEKSLVAYYAAESGIEQALYRTHNGDNSSPISDHLTELSTATWRYTVTTNFNCANRYIQENLAVDHTLEFDNLSGPTRIRLKWSDSDGDTTNDLVEVTWVGWENNFSNFGLNPDYEQVINGTFIFKSLFKYSAIEQNWQGTNRPNNLVRIKPLRTAIKNLTVCFDSVNITDKVRIDTVGAFQSFRKAIESTYTNTGNSASGYVDYAIFGNEAFK